MSSRPHAGSAGPTGGVGEHPGPPAGLRRLVDERAALAKSESESGSLGRPASGRGAARRRRLVDLTESALRELWSAAGPPPGGVALAAVGSLARGDSGPASDLDLVLLHDTRVGDELPAALADSLWYPLWDAGLRLDHSVRTPTQCRDAGEANLTAAVGLLDLRHIAGDEVLVAGARASLSHDWRANARSRLPELLEDVLARHALRGELAHLLEPDLKEAHGGLRDMTVIRALTATWLADRPRGGLDAAYDLLLDVRDALHVVTGRSRERLIHQEHAAVARLLGYPDTTSMQRAVSDAGRLVALSLTSTSRRAGQSQRARSPRHGSRRPVLTPLGHGLYEHDAEVVVGRGADVDDPQFALRAARASVGSGLPLSPTTVDSLATRAQPLPRPWPSQATALLGEVLAAGEPLIDTWEALTLSGLVETWVPCWSEIRSLPQHHPVHRHTVDRHCLQAVVECRRLLTSVRRPDVLLVAALLHDVGKARGSTDHAQVGAPVARAAALDLGFGVADADLVATLVAEHLTLVESATQHDPDDPDTAERLCDAVGRDHDTLDLLHALTEADARAAGPAAWTPWRARLVDGLVARAHERLGVRAVELVGAARADGTPAPAGGGQWRPDLLDGPSVAVAPAADGTALIVDLVAADRVGLFADMAEVLSAQGLWVQAAELRTVDGVATDRWRVRPPRGRVVDADALRRALERRARDGASGRSPRRAPDDGGAPPPPTQVQARTWENGILVELRTLDRAGLLGDVGRALAEGGSALRAAQVTTTCGVTVDFFHVVDEADPEPDDERLAQVVDRVRRAVETA